MYVDKIKRDIYLPSFTRECSVVSKFLFLIFGSASDCEAPSCGLFGLYVSSALTVGTAE
jgi:hypothetical protein